MIVFDTTVLCLTMYANAGVPNDFKTKQPITYAKERVDGLIAAAERGAEVIVIPTPALAEVLVVVSPDVQLHVDKLENQAFFKIVSFGKRAAIEVALRTKLAIKKGNKRDGIRREWDKIKYDRQIVAIAHVEGASIIYSTDEDVHKHGEAWGIRVLNISDLPIPAKQSKLNL
jgi:predicted nucleic acid-binding protein